jgi:hypothetical protein
MPKTQSEAQNNKCDDYIFSYQKYVLKHKAMSKTEKMPLNTNVMAKTTKLMPKTQM